MARLVINPNTSSTWEVQLKPGSNYLGRGFENDFKIDHPSVSTSHCQIVVNGDEAIIRDLGSTNGTFVNRSPINEAPLQPGQSIHLGGVEIAFQAEPAAATIPQRVTAPETLPRPAIQPPRAPGATTVSLPTPAPTARTVTPSAAPSFQAAPPLAAAASTAPGTISPPALSPPVPRPAGISLAPKNPIRVTVAAHAPAVTLPPPPTQVTAAPSITSPAAISSGGPCKFHPKVPGRFLCKPCSQYFCELCVTSRTVGTAQGKFCRHCGAELVPVQVKITHEKPKGFYAQLPGAFVYPFKGAGILVLIVSAIIFACLNFFSPDMRFGYVPRSTSWTLLFRVMAVGYLFSFMQSIIHAAAIGEEEMPSLPSMANFWEDILLPALQFLGLILMCFGPALAVVWYMIANEDTSMLPVLIGAVGLSGLYFPMALLAVAMLDSVMAANPLQVIPSIARVPKEYLVTVILLGVVFSLRPLGDFLIPLIFPKGLTTHSIPKLFGFLGAHAFWGIFSLYLLIVGIRILGLLFYCKRDELGWLDQ